MDESPLAKKLLIKPGQRAVIINPPTGYLESLGPLPTGVELSKEPDAAFDFVQLFVTNSEELAQFAAVAAGAAKRDGILRVSYPKQSSRVKTDLTRDKGWEPLHQAGFVGVGCL